MSFYYLDQKLLKLQMKLQAKRQIINDRQNQFGGVQAGSAIGFWMIHKRQLALPASLLTMSSPAAYTHSIFGQVN